jgi:predicted porin
MKKSLVALGVLATFAGAAGAQSSVTLYGRIDLGLVVDGGNPAGRSARISSGVAKGSSLGFRGSEDLGGGYRAGFQLETGFCSDSAAPVVSGTSSAPNFCSGSNNFMGRQARGELSGPFGAINAGRQFAQAYVNMLKIDPFLGTAGQMNNIIDPSGFRLNNSVRYSTPVFGGFMAQADMALGEQAGNWRGGREIGASVNYDKGPVYAALVLYDLGNTNGVGTARRNIMLGGTYDLRVVKLHALAQRSTGNPTGVALNLDVLDVMLGVSVPVGGGKVQASYVRHDDRTALAQKGDKDANQVAVGYLYALSKAVSLYTAWGRIRNDNGAAFKVGNATEAGVGNRSVNLGMAYDF